MQSYNNKEKAVNLLNKESKPARKWGLHLLLILAVFTTSCDALKDSQLAQIYHDITAKYNGYFNAREIMRDMESHVANNYENNYNEVISVYQFPDESMHKTLAPDADKVIKKCTKVIQKHDISKWVDDCYFLIAKANFYKGEYLEAIENFQYIHSKYQGNLRAHQSLMWIVHAHTNRDKIKEANAVLTRLKSQDNFPDELKKSLWLTEANVNITRGDYNEAAEKLRKAVKEESDRDKRTRYHFILGQIYLKTGDYSSATKYFNRVRSGNAPYEMAFQAKLNLSRCYQRNASKRLDQVKKDLKALLKDEKNLEYVDQIYYELAQIEKHQENWYDYVAYLKLAVRSSQNNQGLQAKSYHELGEHYFEGGFYNHAKTYYDSAVAILPEAYPEADQIQEKQKVLSELVNYEREIQRQDSLQLLAELDTSTLDQRFKQIIANKKRQEKQAELEEQRQSRMNQANQRLGNQSQNLDRRQRRQSSGEWYFYNNTAKSRGANQFQRQWGNRPLRDNWRTETEPVRDQSTEQSPGSQPGDQAKATTDTASQKPDEQKIVANEHLPQSFNNLPEEAKNFYSKIPFTEEQRQASDQKIQEAYYQLGVIYYKRLQNYDRAIENFETLNETFEENQYKLRSYYHLYNIYQEMGNEEKAKTYKNRILNDYPDSKYATLITNPDQLRQESQQDNKALQQLYASAFKAYQNNQCQAVEQKSHKADSSFNDDYLNTKLKYLALICKGRSQPESQLKSNLKAFIDQNSNHPVNEHARNLLNHLNRADQTKGSQAPEEETEQSPFEHDPAQNHYYLIKFPLSEVDVEKAKQAFAQYNKKYFQFMKLSISQNMYDSDHQILMVRTFDTKQQASKYWRSVADDEQLKEKIGISDPEHYVVTKENYKTIVKEDLLSEYQTFFEEKYLEE